MMTILFDNHLEEQLTTLQKESWVQWLSQGLPTRKHERWKYTPLAHLNKVMLQPSSMQSPQQAIPVLAGDCTPIIFQDGTLRQDLSGLDSTFHLEEKETKFEFKKDRSVFASLNHALSRSSWQLTIPANVRVSKPILIVNFLSESAVNGHVDLKICAEENSHAQIYYYNHCLQQATAIQTIHASLMLAQHAHLDYLHYAPSFEQLTHIKILEAELNQQSVLNYTQVDFASQLSRTELDIFLNGKGAEADLKGIYYGHKHLHIDNYLRIYHNASHTRSNQLYKGLATDQSTTVFNGAVHVNENVQAIEAHQLNPNILLSNKASMNTKPELLIYSDDVQCSHGATIGELDEKAIFYLRSRGIPEKLARKMLVEGFIEEILSTLVDSVFSDNIHQTLYTLSKHND